MSRNGRYRPRERGTRPWLIFVGLGIAIGALVVGIVVSRPAGPPDPRAGSEALGPGPPLAITRTPTAYRVVYREDFGLGGSTAGTRTQVLSVRRPFESRRTTLAGAPPGGATLDDQISTLNHIKLSPPGSAPTVLIVPPSLAPFDVRLDASVEQVLAARGAARFERRRVLDRLCQVYRAAESLDNTLTAIAESATSYVDSCVDEAGLVLETARFDNGSMTARDIAVSVTESPTFGDDFAVDVTGTIPVSQGGGSVMQLDPTSSTIAISVSLPTPPQGFTFLGRYAVASEDPGAAQGQRGSGRSVGVFDVYTRGPDFVTVEESGNTAFIALPASPFATPVDVGSLGLGQVIPGARQSEVRVDISRG